MKLMKSFHEKEFVRSFHDLGQRILDFATQGRSFMNIHIRSPSSMASDTVLEHAGDPSAATSVTEILSAG